MRRMQQAVLAVFLGVAVASCDSEHTPKTRTEGPPVVVEAETVRLAQVPVTVTAVGTTEPYARATPGTRLMGRVGEVRVNEGDRVSKGAVLVRIEDQDLTAKRQQVQAVLANAEANVTRMRNLYREKAIPKQKLDEAESGYAQAKGALREVQANLDYSSVASPLDGVIVRKFVQPGDMAAPGAPLFTVEQQHPMKLTVEVGERDLAYVKVDSPVTVEIEALPTGRERVGDVEALVPSADPGSRTFQVRVVIPNSDGQVRSGMFARVGFQKSERPGILVPASALVRRGQLDGVYVIAGDRTHLRWVRLGKSFGSRTEVISGLAPGDVIALTGLDRLEDGGRVEVSGNG
jgi:membrane fusion protein (multidrug efflux system)